MMSEPPAIGSRPPRGRAEGAGLAAILGVLLLIVFSGFAGSGGASPSANTDQPPANRRPPRIDGKAQVGQILQTDRGRWKRDRGATFSYQWRLCDATGTTCADVAGATDRIYPVRPTNVGQRLLIAVTAVTSAGKASASSAPTPVVLAGPVGAPLATTRPMISGQTQPGSLLTAATGTWQGNEPIRFQYRWRRCTLEGGDCEDVERTSQTYLLSARDAGHTLRVLVRAENSIGKSAALSEPTAAVPGAAPSPATAPRNTSPPVIPVRSIVHA